MGAAMIQVRFYTDSEDPRPVKWPIKHPYWVTGYSGDQEQAVIVAYADSSDYVFELWPEVEEFEILEEGLEDGDYTFTRRFPCPDWLKPPNKKVTSA
jgi:hypothetical protein